VRSVIVEPGPDAWRDAVRSLLRAEVPPAHVHLSGAGESSGMLDLFGSGEGGEGVEPGPEPATAPAATGRVTAPRAFFALARRAACHVDPSRYDLLYRLSWRLTHGEPELLEDRADPDVARVRALESAVRRDAHKTKAFVRFRERPDGRFVAWHGAEHRVLRLVGPFFCDRFSDMQWAIFTPYESAAFDGQRLVYGAGIPEHRREAHGVPRDDVLDETWRTYYAAIFNPARLNRAAMRSEMPVKHWRTLPEARLIPELVATATDRLHAMADAASSRPAVGPQAAAAGSSAELADALAGCSACPLHGPATQVVPGRGVGGGVFVLGEQPGHDEDLAGAPFVGPAGQLLDRLLREVGLDREELYLSNAVKHFHFEPRGKRRLHARPKLEHVRACRPWLLRELELMAPRVVLTLGVTATRAVLGQRTRMEDVRGTPLRCDLAPVVLPTWHPAAILRARSAEDRERMRSELAEALRLAGQLARALPPPEHATEAAPSGDRNGSIRGRPGRR